MLKMHFLNVGHGDCTIVEFPSGRIMIVDINNVKSLPDADKDALATLQGISLSQFESKAISLTASGESWNEYYKALLVEPVEYFTENFQGSAVFRYIQTHPDMDHMSGLWHFFFEENIPVLNFWDTNNNKENSEESFSGSPYKWADWLAYRALRHGMAGSPLKEENHKALQKYREDTGRYWSDDGLEVLSPTPDLVEWANSTKKYNELSYVLRIKHAGRSVILPGDAESHSWNAMAGHYGRDLSCDVLKAAHHGRDSGYDRHAFELMDPGVVICSVGKKPATDASDEYSKLSRVLSTRFHGTITLTIWDDGDIWIKDRNGASLHRLE